MLVRWRSCAVTAATRPPRLLALERVWSASTAVGPSAALSASFHTAVSSPASHLVCRRSCATVAVPLSAASSDLACPECGKVFLWQANLARHRAARHGLVVPSPVDERLEALVAQTAALERTLTERRARVKLARRAGHRSAAAVTGSAVESLGTTSASPSLSSSHFAAAVPAGRATLAVTPERVTLWQKAGRVLGNNVSRWVGVGEVGGPVQVGTLEGFADHAPSAASSATGASCPVVLQFTLHVHGYRERRPGQLRLIRNSVTVRCVCAAATTATTTTENTPHTAFDGAFRVRAGDVVRVQGNYALHASYDIISKQSVEHVVVEADMVGLLEAAPSDGHADRAPPRAPHKRSSAQPGRAASTAAAPTATAVASDEAGNEKVSGKTGASQSPAAPSRSNSAKPARKGVLVRRSKKKKNPKHRS